METTKQVQPPAEPITPTRTEQEPAPSFDTPKAPKRASDTNEEDKPRLRRQLSFYYPAYEKKKQEADTSPITPRNEVPVPAPKGAPKLKFSDRLQFTDSFARYDANNPSQITYTDGFGGRKKLVFVDETDDEDD